MMSDSIKTKTLIFAVVMGFIMALYSTSYAQIDAGPEIAAVSAADAPATEVPNDESGALEAAEAEAAEDVDAIQSNPAKSDPAGAAKDVYDALKAGQWLIAFGSALFFLVWGLRFLLMFMKVKWVETKVGGFVLSFGTAFALATATTLVAGQGLSIGLFAAAAMAAWGAAGKWGHFKDALDSLRGIERLPKARVVKSP